MSETSEHVCMYVCLSPLEFVEGRLLALPSPPSPFCVALLLLKDGRVWGGKLHPTRFSFSAFLAAVMGFTICWHLREKTVREHNEVLSTHDQRLADQRMVTTPRQRYKLHNIIISSKPILVALLLSMWKRNLEIIKSKLLFNFEPHKEVSNIDLKLGNHWICALPS